MKSDIPAYTIEKLVMIFSAHAEEYEKMRADQHNKDGKTSYEDSFNIASAFLTFAKEIESLKNSIKSEEQ